MYPQQKEAYGTRADYKKPYRQEHPEYVRRNAAFVKEHRRRCRQPGSKPVSPTSCDLRLSVWSQTINVSIAHVSHTSRDILVSFCQEKV
jgi:hypothetical protein